MGGTTDHQPVSSFTWDLTSDIWHNMEVKHCTVRMRTNRINRANRTFDTIWRSNIVHWGWGQIELDFNFVFKICFCLVYCLSPMAQFCQFSNFSRTKRFSSVFGTIQRNNRNVFMLNLFLYLILYSFFTTPIASDCDTQAARGATL